MPLPPPHFLHSRVLNKASVLVRYVYTLYHVRMTREKGPVSLREEAGSGLRYLGELEKRLHVVDGTKVGAVVFLGRKGSREKRSQRREKRWVFPVLPSPHIPSVSSEVVSFVREP